MEYQLLVVYGDGTKSIIAESDSLIELYDKFTNPFVPLKEDIAVDKGWHKFIIFRQSDQKCASNLHFMHYLQNRAEIEWVPIEKCMEENV